MICVLNGVLEGHLILFKVTLNKSQKF